MKKGKEVKKEFLVLFLIIVIAALLRFWQLEVNPPSLTWDEAAWGYNAYSLGIDGRDEFGRFLPVDYIESFGDFKPPLYAYLSILPIKMFGLTEFGTRFASAFFGVLTVFLTYFLTRRIFFYHARGPATRSSQGALSSLAYAANEDALLGSPSARVTPRLSRFEILPLLVAGIMAISPWHILLSRGAFEANVATFFIVLGVLLFLISISRGVATNPPPEWKSSVVLFPSIISFVLSMYTFNTARIVSPLLLLGLCIGYRNILWRVKQQVFLAFVSGFILFIPLGGFLLTPQSKLRFHEVNIFSDISVIGRTNQEIKNDHNTFWSDLIHNRRFAYSVEYLKHYFDNLNPWFLFIKGDGNPKFSIQDVGQMYLWEIPFFAAGILFLFKKREGLPAGRQGNWWVIPYWLVVGLIPAATARETPHALRIEATLPTFQILTGYGLYHLSAKLNPLDKLRTSAQSSKLELKWLTACLLAGIIFFNFFYFIHSYFVHYPKEFSGEWQYGYKDALAYVKEVGKDYDRIYFTEGLGRPYIYVLFHSKYDPGKFRSEAVVEREVFGFVHIKAFGKYIFAKNLSEFYSENGKSLYVDTPDKVPSRGHMQKKFFRLNGEITLVAYTI